MTHHTEELLDWEIRLCLLTVKSITLLASSAWLYYAHPHKHRHTDEVSLKALVTELKIKGLVPTQKGDILLLKNRFQLSFLNSTQHLKMSSNASNIF